MRPLKMQPHRSDMTSSGTTPLFADKFPDLPKMGSWKHAGASVLQDLMADQIDEPLAACPLSKNVLG
jgi:hypothetical protein